jgi:hypothetical protein
MALWTPADITTSLWLDASDTNTITVDTGVSNWADKSGNGNDAAQAVVADQPSTGVETIGGLNALGFNEDVLTLTSEITTTRTIFFVTDALAGSNEFATTSPLTGDSAGNSDYTFIRGDTDYSISIDGAVSTSGHASINGGSLVAGGNIDLSVSVAVKSSPALWYVDYDAVVGVYYIGGFLTNVTYKLIGNIGEVLVFDTILTDSERQKIEGYLAWKWGLQANLPNSHPFKSFAPGFSLANVPANKKLKLTNILPTVADDDFTGTDGDAPNPLLWSSGGGAGCIVEIDTNKLKFYKPVGTLSSYAETKYGVSGDFDIQVDWSIDSAVATNGWATGLLMEFASGDILWLARKYDVTQHYMVISKVGDTWSVQDTDITTATSGKLRVVRSGSTVAPQYWNGSSWATMANTLSDSGAVSYFQLNLNGNAGADPSMVSRFDNFTVNSGTIVWPEIGERPLDPHWDNVVLALPFDGTDGSTTITDISSTPKTITRYGTPITSTTQSVFGGSSLYLNGSSWLLTPCTPFLLGADPFTAEAWVYPTNITAPRKICGIWYDTSSQGFSWKFYISTGGLLRFLYSTTGGDGISIIEDTASISIDNWYHVAVTRGADNKIRLFVNGICTKTSDVITATFYAAPATKYFEVGRDGAGTTAYYYGYIDDLRITKGVARYTADFTLPTKSVLQYLPDPVIQLPIILRTNQPPESADDDFTGTDGDAPNPLLWGVTNSSVAGTATILSNKLRVAVPSTTQDEAITLIQRAAFYGDFDFQIDYNVVVETTPSSSTSYPARLILYTASTTGYQLQVGKAKPSAGSDYMLAGSISGDSSLPVLTLPNSKLRITRVGSVIKAYYWNNSRWEWGGSTAGYTFTYSSTVDLIVGINTSADFNAGSTTDFDNFTVNSGTIVWPDNINPGSGVTGFDAGLVFDELNVTDPHWDNVVLALPFDGTDGSTTITDISSTPKTVTVVGNAHIEADQSKFGGTSAYFDGTGDYLTIPTSTDFNFGSGDSTVECWIKTATTLQYQSIVARGIAWTAGSWILLINNTVSGGEVAVYSASGGDLLVFTSGVSVIDNNWHHIAWVRNGTVHLLFVDGIIRGTATLSYTIADISATLAIAQDLNFAGRDYAGYIDDLRITKGIARYTADFIPPIRSISETTPTNGSLKKKLAIYDVGSDTECKIEIPPNSWDAKYKSAMILATVPSLSSSTELTLYFDSTQDDNEDVIDVDPLPAAPTDPYTLAVYNTALGDTLFTWAILIAPALYFSGYVQVEGVPAVRPVVMFNRSTYALEAWTTSASGTGYFELSTTNSGIYFVNILPELNDTYNILAYDKIILE